MFQHPTRWLLAAVGILGAVVVPMGLAAGSGGPAVLTVQPTRPVALGTFGDGVAIHPNRDYTFARVPDELKGLQFTSHEHKATGGYTCTVKSAGTVYLCLQKPATPKGLKLAEAWEPRGRMDTVINGRSYPWGIWRLAVAAGQTLKIPAPDRWGAVLAAKRIENLKPAPPRPKGRSRPNAKPDPATPADEFGWLARDIANRKWHAKIADQAFCEQALILPSDRDPADVVLRRTAALLADLTARDDAPDLSARAAELKALTAECAKLPLADEAARRKLLARAVKLRRRIAFANPLLDFDKILFIKRHDAGGPFHMCDQYYGCNAKPGGGLFVLHDPFGENPRAVDLLADSVVEKGRLEGSKLVGGSFLSPELSFDGKTILFAYTQAKATKTYTWGPELSYHIFRCNAGGGELAQLTDGDSDDFDPCFLPNGRVVFVTERRGGYLRCGRHCPTYTMYSMNADGSGIECFSFHETHEWHPSVANDGRVVYTRWDYVDRDTNVAHHIWLCYPDGRDPRSFHGNYPAERRSRPWMEMSIRAIPGSDRFVATTGAHHGHAFGSLVLIDHRGEDDGAMSQLRRLTPEAPFPEAEGNTRRLMAYGTAWPLSEKYYLCAHDPAAKNHGLYLIDCFGNRELLYRDASIASVDPIPLRPRPRPAVIPPQRSVEDGAMAVVNVYDGDFTWPAGAKVAALRIIQVLPKTTPPPNKPRIGVANQTNARAVLGTVPVEADGSAHFDLPAGKLVYFQALDEKGLAIQSMRSATYVRAGQRVVCQGCHEPKRRAPAPPAGMPLALRRGPSKIRRGPEGSYPFSYVRLVQPVLDKHCVGCHVKKKALDLTGAVEKGGWTRSYARLAPKYGFYFHVSNGSIKTGVHGGARTVPGRFGAAAAPLMKYLGADHYDVKLSAEERRRITLWLDCNSEFYGAYEKTDAQARGEVVVPALE